MSTTKIECPFLVATFKTALAVTVTCGAFALHDYIRGTTSGSAELAYVLAILALLEAYSAKRK